MTMEPGRELDALILEKVFKWRWVVMQRVKPLFGGGAGDEIDCLVLPDCPDSGPLRLGFMVERGAVHEGSLDWSTNMVAAWELVEKLKDDGWQWNIGIDEDGCDIDITKGDDNYYTYDGKPNPEYRTKHEVDADTAPHAICLAALKALEDQ